MGVTLVLGGSLVPNASSGAQLLAAPEATPPPPAATLTGIPRASAPHQSSCPDPSRREFCRWKAHFEALERARARIVATAREEGMEQPSGLIVLLRNGAGTLTIQKVDLQLPETVEARLNGFLTPLVMEHMDEAPGSLILELNPARPDRRPHPDSASRPPTVKNRDALRERLERMTESLEELPSQVQAELFDRDSVRIMYEALVDSRGRVRHVRVLESSGKGPVDRYFARLVARLELDPTVSYGVPHAGRLVQPVTLSVRGRDSGTGR